MVSLKQRLLAVEDEFLAALADGEGAMCAFELHWEKLLLDVDIVHDSEGLDDETSTLVHTIALRVATLAETSTSIYASYEVINSELMGHIDTLISELTISDRYSEPLQQRVCPETVADRCSAEPHSPPRTNCKRQRSLESSESVERTKRRRLVSQRKITQPLDERPMWPINDELSVAVVSSASPSAHHDPAPSQPSLVSADATQRSSRKRRSSDADLNTLPRAKRFHVGPRVHAVSDSFASSMDVPPKFSRFTATIDSLSSMGLQRPGLDQVELDVQPLVSLWDNNPFGQYLIREDLSTSPFGDSLHAGVTPTDLDQLLQSWFPSPNDASQVFLDSSSPESPLSHHLNHPQEDAIGSPAYSSAASTPPPRTPLLLSTQLEPPSSVFTIDDELQPVLRGPHDLPAAPACASGDTPLSTFEPTVQLVTEGIDWRSLLDSLQPYVVSESLPFMSPSSTGWATFEQDSLSGTYHDLIPPVDLSRLELHQSSSIPLLI